MTSIGRQKLWEALDRAIYGVLDKYHLTPAEVIGVMMIQVAMLQQQHIKGLNEGGQDDPESNQDEKEDD